MYKYWSTKEISLLKNYYPKLRVKELAKMFPNRNKGTIVAKALSLGLPSAKLWQLEENNILRKHFAETSIEKLMKLLPKRSKLAIWAQGERLDLKRNTNKPRRNVNESYFKKWSPNMTYLLGFILADGSITEGTYKGYSDTLKFGVKTRDIDILKKIKQELASEHAISLVKANDSTHLAITSQIIVDDLKRLGVSYRKSFRKSRGKIPNIPQKYIRDFIRGIADGDGSINFDKRGYPNLNICGKKEIITFIRDHFLSKFDIYSKITQAKKNGQYYNLFYIYYRCNSAKTLINYLYDNASLYLERKFRLAKQCLKIKIKHKKNYTKREKLVLQQFYHVLPKDKILLILLNRSWQNIQQKARGLGLYKYNIKNNKLCV